MNIKNCYIEGIKILEPSNIHKDNRGYLYEFYKKSIFLNESINDIFVQEMNHTQHLVF